ncbi:hypothetical protein WJX73_002315 [Symbiochloris irregularis]|uniref:Calnexin n=1 Tax=Symbiochloris irregularis TaxID=706552 RepID=A0AAW1NP59_9CHLO
MFVPGQVWQHQQVLNADDNTYDVLIDGESKKTGSLFEDFEPSINPPEEIDDPKDKKPASWVENPKMPDPKAKKPADWDEDAPRTIDDPDAEKPEEWLDDEPEEVDDPEAEQPEDWDEEEDGEWEAPRVANPKCTEAGCGEWKPPTIPNPAYKGKWSADLIDNPDYKGVWAPRKIANPDFFTDETPLKNLADIGGVAIEIWTMDDSYYFSSIYVGTDADKAEEHRTTYWAPKKEIEDKQAEEEAAKLKEESSKLSEEDDGETLTLADRIIDAFDSPPLAALKPYVGSLLDQLEEHPNFAWLVLLAPALVLLSLLRRVFGKSKPAVGARTPTTRAAKKGDVTGPDDSLPAQAASVARTAQAKASEAARTAQAKASEAVAQATGSAGDEDEDEAVKQRRPRRDT